MSVPTRRLDDVLDVAGLTSPRLMKVDVQGFELELLRGAERSLLHFHQLLVECSFLEVYRGQAVADEVICHLFDYGFRLSGVFSPAYTETGRCAQADLLFDAR